MTWREFLDARLREDVRPDWQDGVPACSERCPSHDGKRCGILGHKPPTVCEPTIKALVRYVRAAERTTGEDWILSGHETTKLMEFLALAAAVEEADTVADLDGWLQDAREGTLGPVLRRLVVTALSEVVIMLTPKEGT